MHPSFYLLLDRKHPFSAGKAGWRHGQGSHRLPAGRQAGGARAERREVHRWVANAVRGGLANGKDQFSNEFNLGWTWVYTVPRVVL